MTGPGQPYDFGKNSWKRYELELIRGQLKEQRSSWIDYWMDLSSYIAPTRSRFFTTDVNKGVVRTRNIIDTTPTLAMRGMQSGMLSGMTPPSREWFRLTFEDLDLAETPSVKDWLWEVSRRMHSILQRSNFYQTIPIIYGDVGTFGTAGTLMEEDPDTVVRFYPQPLGSFSISNNARLQVDTMVREFEMTVREIVEKFADGGKDFSNVSDMVKSLWETGNTEQWVQVVHVICPNKMYDEKRLESKYKKYYSCYYELGSVSGYQGNYLAGPSMIDPNKYLSEKGYDFFPGLYPRWQLNGEDAYGTNCPGMVALGDIRQLQIQERRIAQAIEKMVNPPMKGPTSLRNMKAAITPGFLTYTDSVSGGTAFGPAQEVNPGILAIEEKQQQIRERINQAFFMNLFLMSAYSEDPRKTATEIRVREEERLMALGPMLEQFNDDCLKPLIRNLFAIMLKRGLVPEPPEEIQGMEMDIEFMSMFAQAQRMLSTGGLERFAGFYSSLLQLDPSVRAKVDTDQILDAYAAGNSLPPGIIRTDEAAAEIRAKEQQAMQAQMMAEQAQMMSQSVKNLGQTPVGTDSALDALTGSVA